MNVLQALPDFRLQLLMAGILGLILGFERALRHKEASLRTFAMICFGCCLFTVISVHIAELGQGASYDITRIAAGVVTGIGFVGGGIIFKATDRIRGVSTAAMLWMVASIGMACGLGRIDLALWGVFVYEVVILAAFFFHRFIETIRPELNGEG